MQIRTGGQEERKTGRECKEEKEERVSTVVFIEAFAFLQLPESVCPSIYAFPLYFSCLSFFLPSCSYPHFLAFLQ
jgi:hypothetical protein